MSPGEDASAQELSNITIPDPPEVVWRLDCFGEHLEGHNAEAPAQVFNAGAALCKEKEVIEQALPDREEVGSKGLEESEESEANSESSEEGPAKEPAKEPMIDHPALRWESLPEHSHKGEEKDEIDCLC